MHKRKTKAVSESVWLCGGRRCLASSSGGKGFYMTGQKGMPASVVDESSFDCASSSLVYQHAFVMRTRLLFEIKNLAQVGAWLKNRMLSLQASPCASDSSGLRVWAGGKQSLLLLVIGQVLPASVLLLRWWSANTWEILNCEAELFKFYLLVVRRAPGSQRQAGCSCKRSVLACGWPTSCWCWSCGGVPHFAARVGNESIFDLPRQQ